MANDQIAGTMELTRNDPKTFDTHAQSGTISHMSSFKGKRQQASGKKLAQAKAEDAKVQIILNELTNNTVPSDIFHFNRYMQDSNRNMKNKIPALTGFNKGRFGFASTFSA